jgi:fluoride exporter
LSFDRLELGAVCAGGAVGAIARAGAGEALSSGGPGWPWATFVVNIAGAFALGYFITRLLTTSGGLVTTETVPAAGTAGGLRLARP